MARFKNPNEPPQPQPGVYGWFLDDGTKSTCIYIGEAGNRRSAKLKGTLLRGVTELQRETFSSNHPGYNKLDTDFVVGTAIRFFEKYGFTVYWKHLSNDPSEEAKLAKEWNPVLQDDRPHLFSELKAEKKSKGYWRWPKEDFQLAAQKLDEAEKEVFKAIENLLSNKGLKLAPALNAPPPDAASGAV